MSGRLDFEVGFNTNNAQSIDDNSSMRVYFLGDFSGAQSAAENDNINKIVKIDIDSFDEVMTRLCPSVNLPSGHQLNFNELEDFHPDNLFETAIFKDLRRLKRELAHVTTAEQAAQEILSRYQLSPESVDQSNNEFAPPSNNADGGKIEQNDDMFERLLGQKQSAPISPATSVSATQATGTLDVFLAQLLSPHIIKDAKPEHQSLMIFIDSALEELMNSILHSTEFQALESAWRSVREVIFNAEYDDEKQLFYIINTDRNALENAVSGDPGLATQFSQHIQDTDTDCYDVLVGHYQFSADDADISALNYLASLAEALKCQLLSGANDDLINANQASLWQQFRQTPQASHVALSYPRVLLRLPYGKQHDEVDAFAFEEFRQTHQHNHLLWGNSAFACARLLIRQYHGQIPFDGHLTELPAFVYTDDGEQKLYPCGELLLSEQQLIEIRQQGIIPFASFRNKNCIRLFGDEIRAVNA